MSCNDKAYPWREPSTTRDPLATTIELCDTPCEAPPRSDLPIPVRLKALAKVWKLTWVCYCSGSGFGVFLSMADSLTAWVSNSWRSFVHPPQVFGFSERGIKSDTEGSSFGTRRSRLAHDGVQTREDLRRERVQIGAVRPRRGGGQAGHVGLHLLIRSQGAHLLARLLQLLTRFGEARRAVSTGTPLELPVLLPMQERPNAEGQLNDGALLRTYLIWSLEAGGEMLVGSSEDFAPDASKDVRVGRVVVDGLLQVPRDGLRIPQR